VGVLSPPDANHTAVITAAELAAGGELILHIQGDAPHDHEVRLASVQVSAIRDGIRVTQPSSETEGHFHNVTFN
jgi:hypothetical protein